MVRVRRALLPVLVTAVLCAVVIFVGGRLFSDFSGPRQRAMLEVLSLLPYVLLLMVAMLGLQLNQTRIVSSAILFAGLYALLSFPVPLSLAYRAQASALAMPFSLALSFLLRERRLWKPRSLVRLLILALPLGLLFMGYRLSIGPIVWFVQWQWLADLSWWHLPDLSLFLFLGLAIAVFWKSDRYIRDFTVPFLSSVIVLFIAFNQLAASPVVPVSSLATIRYQLFLYFLSSSLVLLIALSRMYWQKVYIDELSGIPNRRALNERLEDLDRDYCIAMIDIDHFKKFNDTYGHDEGDNAIRFVASHLDVGSGGRAYRYGGEEFCLVFDKTSLREAVATANRIRVRLGGTNFYIRKARSKTWRQASGKGKSPGKFVHITASIGVAAHDEGRATAAEVIQAADRALYSAKKRGRNRVDFEE